MRKIRVLIVDDSALVRQILTDLLSADPGIEVMGAVGDPYLAANRIREDVPDIITLDIEMPRMDGLTFLQVIMSQKPIPVIILSSLTEKATKTTMKALELGALDVIRKPTISSLRKENDAFRHHILSLIKASVHMKISKRRLQKPGIPVRTMAAPNSSSMIKTTEKVIVIGASTGGTEAIRQILIDMPHDSPAIVIVQHMPELYTRSFANRLNELCRIHVKEAQNGDTLIRGQALIAPGNLHTRVRRSGAKYYVEVFEGEHVNRHRPSVDVLFESAAKFAGKNAVGMLLTGMGKDGAKGLASMKEAGAFTIAQDEETSVVFGMPREAIRLGAAIRVEPLDRMSQVILQS